MLDRVSEIKNGFSVVVVTMRKNAIRNILGNYDRQSFCTKELIIIINNDGMSREDFEPYIKEKSNVHIEQIQEQESLGNCLNIGYSRAKYDYIAKMDDDDYYGKYYLQEAYDLFIKEACDIVCKYSIFYYLKAYGEVVVYPRILDYTRIVRWGSGATICMTRKAFNRVGYSDLRREVDVDLFVRCRDVPGLKVYSMSSYNFLCIREVDNTQHTWTVTSAYLKDRSNQAFGTHKMTLEQAYKFIELYPISIGKCFKR